MKSDEDPRQVIDIDKYSNASLYLNSKNLGFSGGNNWGISKARGEFLFIVNNDTEVTPNIIEKLLTPFSIDNKIGVVCPKIKYFSNKDVIQYAGFTKINSISGRSKTVGFLEKDLGQFDDIRVTFAPHGAAMMVRKDVIEDVGGFPESFFLYYEELDLGARVLAAGYKIYVQGFATIYHKESMSVGKLNPMKQYYLTRNRILYMRRNCKLYEFPFFLLFFTFLTVPKTVLLFVLKGQYSYLKAFLRGIRDNFFMSSFSVT